MPEGRVLILDADYDAALAAVQSLARQGLAVEVAASTEDCLAFRSRRVRARHTQPPPARCEEFLGWLRRLDAERSYELIVPATELSLVALCELPESDRLRRLAVMPSNRALDVALDKHATWRLARDLGVRVPASAYLESLDAVPPAGSFPRVLKPVRSKIRLGDQLLSPSPQIVVDAEQRVSFLRRWLPHVPVLEQDYVPGVGIGIELLYDRGCAGWHFAHERLHELPLTGGGSTYRRAIRPPPEALAAARSLFDALEYHGVGMVEFKRAGKECTLIEINPRLWGSLALSVASGCDFPLGLYRLASGGSLPPQPAYRVGHRARNLAADTEWLLENLRADPSDRLLLTRPRVRSFLELLRFPLPSESFDHFDLRDPGVAWGILRKIAGRVWATVARRAKQSHMERRLRRAHKTLVAKSAGNRPVRSILFLCYGNICRSPVASELARRRLGAHEIVSAGFHEVENRRSPEYILREAQALGVDLSGHRSRRVTPEMVARADLILLMDLGNYEALCATFPGSAPKSTLLGLFLPEAEVTIVDPYGGSDSEVRRVLAQIDRAVEGFSAWCSR